MREDNALGHDGGEEIAMTGKQLKDFAAQVHDDAIIEVREKNYTGWEREFEMQALYVYIVPKVKATDEAV